MAIAPSFSTGLLGYDPLEQQRQQQKLWAGMYSQASSPYEKIGMGVGQLGAALVGGLMGESPQQKKEKAVADIKQKADAQFVPGSAEYFRFVAENLPAEYSDSKAYAMQEAMKAQAAAEKTYLERVKTVTENPQQLGIVSAPLAAQAQAQIAKMSADGQPLNEQQIAALQASPQYQQLVGLTSAQQAGIEKQAPATPEFVNKELLAQAIQDSDGDVRKGAILYNERRLAEREKVAKASVTPAPGRVPLGSVKSAQDIIDDYTKKPFEKLQQIKVIAGTGEGVKNNPSLLPTFQKEVAGFVRDSQISNADFKRALGSSGIVADAIDGVNKFFLGAPTDAKIDDILKGWKVVEKIYADQYNSGLKKATTVLDQGDIAPETRAAILPSPYIIPKAPPKVGEIRGGYRFKGGDPADKNNYVKVQ
jgi:hypothetical protein